MFKKALYILLLFSFNKSISQETAEPYFIKSIQLKTNNPNDFSSIIPLGSRFTLSFDDLEADQKDYYYKIELMTYDWKPSNLLPNQYIQGYPSNSILNVENAFNTLQNYTHYRASFPNDYTRILKSGNYVISVLDELENVVFTRRLVLYESLATLGVNVSRGRSAEFKNKQQSIGLIVNYPNIRVNNPNQEIKVAILQNNDWNTLKTNLKPNFYKPKQLVFNNTNLWYWGGNEYLHFDTKILRNSSLNVEYIEKKEVFNHHLFPYENRNVKSYTYNPDINGAFVIRSTEGTINNTESDYVLMHFTITNTESINMKPIYIYGSFNNFAFNDENKMTYLPESKKHVGSLLLKQGFYNYTYVTVDQNHAINQRIIRGNFSKTENTYTAIAYYKPFGEIYDRVIGIGSINFEGDR